MADKKLNDEEKMKLIDFYKGNPCLWDGDNLYRKKKKKKKKAEVKENLLLLFEGKYTIENLKKTHFTRCVLFCPDL